MISDSRSAATRCFCAVAALLAGLAGASLAQQPAAAPGAATTNAEIAAQIADGETALARASGELAQLRKAKGDLDNTMEWIDRRAQVHALGREFAQTLIQQLRRLPRPEQFAAARVERARLLARTSDANFRAQRTLRELGEIDATAPPALAEHRDLLKRLDEVQDKLVETLREADEAERDRDRHSQAARAKLTRLLFWIPAPPSTQTISELVPSLAWTASPANWREALEVLGGEAARRPFWPATALLVAVILYALRGRLQRALISLAPTAVTYQRYRIYHALAALAVTFALALPGPMVLWIAGSLLGAAPDSQHFALALGDAFSRISRLVLALSGFAWLLDRRGVAVSHFGWDEASLGFASRALRRFAALFVPLMFIGVLNGLDYAPFANRESLGRLAFSVGMIVLAAFVVHLLRRKSPLMQGLFLRAPRSWAVSLHGFWLGALVALPLALGALSAAGYFVAAEYFFGRTMISLFLVLGALMLYGLIALWVRLQRYHLRARREEEAPRPAVAWVAGEAGSEVAEVRPADLDVAALGEQTRSLLDLLITLLLLGGIWMVWESALPVLSVIGDYALWTYDTTLGGKPVTRSVTLGALFLALIVAAVTAVAVRNIGALLDIVLLQRLDMQADATYAVKVVTQYTLAAAGVLVASNILGIGWGDVQWLIAALGVGLGFGLQEIVANFVSGLIVLAERPIRIGDFVTVGNVEGTVARIRARATVVVDSDNKEVIIPNKAFITERVANWTLSDQTTRLLLKVGVPSGSDVALVQRVLLDAVRGNSDVLQVPPPSVFLAGVGDKSLNFEIRACVESLDKRLRVQHEINAAIDRALRENGI